MLGHQCHSDTTRYHGDCTYVRGCVWKMEREREREIMCAENGGWILQSKKPSVTQGSCRGGGLEYSNGWLAESWQWLCDLSQPVGTRALCSGHDNKESVAWNWRTWVPLFLPAGKPGWSSPWGQTSMQVEGKKKVPTTLSWELSITEEQLYVTIIYTSLRYI